MRRSFNTCFFLLFGFIGYSQTTFNVILDSNNDAEHSNSVLEVSGGYISSGGGLLSSFDGWRGIKIIKTDLAGNILWIKQHGKIASAWSDGNPGCLIQSNQGGFAMAGYLMDSARFDLNAALYKFDDNGDLQWIKTFGSYWDEYFSNVIQDSDGNYLLIGQTKNFDADGDIYLVKTDSLGNLKWEKNYGGNMEETGSELSIASDGSYLLAGGSKSFGIGSTNIYLLKTDTSGNIKWSAAPGNAADYCGTQQIIIVSDGGYVMCGCEDTLQNSSRLVSFIQKTDSSGNNILWRKYLPGTFTQTSTIWSIAELEDDSIIVVGSLVNFEDGGSQKGLVVKFDNEGNKIWERLHTYGNNNGWELYDIKQTGDGGFICTGNGLGEGSNGSDFWLLKLDSNGCFGEDSCGLVLNVGINENQPIPNSSTIVAYPNPFTTHALISIKANSAAFANEKIQFQMFDVSGRLLQTSSYALNQYGYCEFYVQRIQYPSGIYFYQVTTQKDVLGKGKLVIR